MKPSRRLRLIERITRPIRKRAYNKRRDRIIVATYKWEQDRPRLNKSYNPLANDEHICLFPPPEIPPKWDDEEQKAQFFEKHTKEPSEVEQFLRRAKQDLKKKQFINPETGKLNERWNPLAIDDDCCPPIRENYNPLECEEDFFIARRS